MHYCCVCSRKVLNVEEAELSKDKLYCDFCSGIVTSGTYPEVLKPEGYKNVMKIRENRFQEVPELDFND